MPLASDTAFGVYEVLSPLGAGGMGEVYRARDRRLGREVALKVLPSAAASLPSTVDVLLREARLLASLSHPNIAVLYGFEEWNGIRALVMELVPGETLERRLSRGPLGVRLAVSVGRQAAAALECAHRQGIVHRDLKPSNVMLLPDGSVKVLDFGLARVFAPALTSTSISQSPTLVSGQTHPGTIVGTIAYMSPEQARGLAVDRQTDVWALGCLLFEAATGKRAFGGATAADTFAAILEREPVWDQLPPDVPDGLRDLLRRCLRKDKGHRLHDVADARVELEALEATIPRTASAPGTTAPTLPAPRPDLPSAPRAAWSLGGGALRAAALALLALLAVGAVLWTAGRTSNPPAAVRERVLVVLPFRDLDPEGGGGKIGEGLAENLAARIARQGGIQIIAAPLTPGEADLGRMVRELGVSLALRGSVQRQAALARVTFSLLELPGGAVLAGDAFSGPSSDLFALEDRVVDRVLSFLLPGAARTASRSLAEGEGQDRYFSALGLLRRSDDEKGVSEAIRLLGSIPDGDRSALVQAALTRAFLYRYRLTRDRSWADRALEASKRASTLDAGLPEVPLAAGEILLATGQPDQAERSFRAALTLRPTYVEALQGLGRTLDALGKTADAEGAHRRVVALRPSWPQGWVQLGNLEYRRGSFAEAETAYRKAASLDPDDARIAYRLAAVLYERGHLDAARTEAERSIALDPTPQALSNLGTVLYALGRFGEAAKAFERATGSTSGDATLWVNLGDARRQAGDLDGALAAYRKAASAADQETSVNPKDDKAHLGLALAYGRLGQSARARSGLERALALAPNDPENLFQAAILELSWGRPDVALEKLERSVKAGKKPAVIDREPDLSALRSDPRFRALTGAGRKKEGG